MKNLIVVLAATVAFSLTAAAQTSGARAQGSADNQKASSAQAKPSKQDKNKEVTKGDASTAKAAKLTGCLSGPNDEGAYVLKNSAHKRGVEVGGSDDLKANVGHQVQLTGAWTTSGADIGEQEKGKHEKNEKHFKVASVNSVKDTCEAGGAKSAAKSHSKAAKSSYQDTTKKAK